MKINEIIARLKRGNERFVKDRLALENQGSNRRQDVIKGQNPLAIILGCADSRVVPELIFDTGIGELFVVRVAGNVANTSTIASIEYAVAHLETKVIVVLSHQSCGAVTAAVVGGDNGVNLNHLLALITPAIADSGENATVDDISRKNAQLTVMELAHQSHIISNAVKNDSLKIIPAYYNLDTGIVEYLV